MSSKIKTTAALVSKTTGTITRIKIFSVIFLGIIFWLHNIFVDSDSSAPPAFIYSQNNPDFKATFEQAVREEDANAQFVLGLVYYRAALAKTPRPQDPSAQKEWMDSPQLLKNAIMWFEKSAQQKNPEAINHLGILYYYGHGVAQDEAKAKEFFEAAASQHLASAEYNLGFLYDKGSGVERNAQKAKEWFDKARSHDFLEPMSLIAEKPEKSAPPAGSAEPFA